MFVKNLEDCPEFIAGDRSILRELLHPDKGGRGVGDGVGGGDVDGVRLPLHGGGGRRRRDALGAA